MADEKKSSIEAITALRGGLFEIISITVLVALGINLLASGIISSFRLTGWAITMLGGACSLLGLSYLFVKVKPANSRRFEFHGVLVIDNSKERRVVEIDRYDFSERASEYVKGLTAENKALAKLWRESSFELDVDFKTKALSHPKPDANELVREAVEYYLLNKLSLHLSDYFENNSSIQDDQIERFQRQDIPNILLRNRFLELFSKPMEQREAFMNDPPNRADMMVVYAQGEGGAVFDHFELILPKGTVVKRSDVAGLEIRTSRFHLQVKPVFEGYATNLPERFEELYLGYQMSEVNSYAVGIVIEVDFRLASLFSITGWEYYRWLDSFLEEMAASFSFERFVRTIGWATSVSTIIALGHLKQKDTSKATHA